MAKMCFRGHSVTQVSAGIAVDVGMEPWHVTQNTLVKMRAGK